MFTSIYNFFNNRYREECLKTLHDLDSFSLEVKQLYNIPSTFKQGNKATLQHLQSILESAQKYTKATKGICRYIKKSFSLLPIDARKRAFYLLTVQVEGDKIYRKGVEITWKLTDLQTLAQDLHQNQVHLRRPFNH